MRNVVYFIVLFIVIMVNNWFVYNLGKDRVQQTIEDRALELPDPYEVDDTYSWGDIEYVVFGESQE